MNNVTTLMKTRESRVIPFALALVLVGCNSEESTTPPIIEDPDVVIGWNINQWKLTLPVSEKFYKENYGISSGLNERDSASELIPAECSGKDQLLTTTDLPYFQIAQDQKTHFIVDLGGDGIATTDNTSYARSELRELYNYSAGNRCSASEQNWRVGDDNNHRLSATLTIESHPSFDVTGEIPKVIVGQVHGYKIKQALIKLQWEGDNTPVRAILNDTFVPDDKSCDHCQSFSVELGTVNTQTPWDYSIEVNDTGVVLSAAGVEKSIDWGEEIEWKDKTYVLDSDWKQVSNSFYFKAGIYPQIKPNKDFSGETFDVSFDEITVEHK